jgi:trypsin
VVSPATIDAAKSTQIGTVTKIIDQITLVELAPDFEATNGPIGGLAESVPVGATVTLVGRTSKTATGKVAAISATVKLYNEPDLLKDVIFTERMSSAGDAGAPVLDENKKLVGIVIAGSTENPSKGLVTAVMPVMCFTQ